MSKKLIAGAGVVASFAVALAPLATFATTNEYEQTWASDQHTDHFTINVPDTCAFGHLAVGTGDPLVGVSHNDNSASSITGQNGEYDGMATWTNDATTGVIRNTGRTPDNASGSLTNVTETDEAVYTMEAGTTKSGFATTTLTVYCNNSTDAHYTLKVNMDANLYKGGISSNPGIPANADYDASHSGYAIDSVVAGSGSHGAVKSGTGEAFEDKFGTSGDTIMATSTTGTLTTGDAYTVTYGIGVASSQEAGSYTGNVVYTLYQGVGEDPQNP